MSDSRPLRPLIRFISSPMFALPRHFLSASSCHQRSAHLQQPPPSCFLLSLSFTRLLTMRLLCCRQCNIRIPCPPFATLSPEPPCESLRVLIHNFSPCPYILCSSLDQRAPSSTLNPSAPEKCTYSPAAAAAAASNCHHVSQSSPTAISQFSPLIKHDIANRCSRRVLQLTTATPFFSPLTRAAKRRAARWCSLQTRTCAHCLSMRYCSFCGTGGRYRCHSDHHCPNPRCTLLLHLAADSSCRSFL